jgi:hypothetical protein
MENKAIIKNKVLDQVRRQVWDQLNLEINDEIQN